MGRYGSLLLLLLTLGCEKGEECTKARLAASDAWQNVTSQAANAKVKGWVGFDDLSEPQKAESVKTWTAIEIQAEMVFKSFAYERITWKTSDPARQEARQKFDGYFAKDNFSLFAASLKAAEQKYEEASKLCRK
jgi:hypothetical protein